MLGMGDMIVLAVLGLAIGLAAAAMWRSKKRGGGCAGCSGCSGCPSAGSCPSAGNDSAEKR